MISMATVTGSSPVRTIVNRTYNVLSGRRVRQLGLADPVATQARECLRLVEAARATRFGKDHLFASIQSVEDYQKAVPLRHYEDLWREYLQPAYPVLDNLTWPGRIPYFALTSGTTQGATKYIPVSREMLASNRKAGQTMMAYHMVHRGDSRLFHGRLFFLGGSTALEQPAEGIFQGDLSGIVAKDLPEFLRPYTFPPLDLALESNWETKLDRLAERSVGEDITWVAGVPSWLLMLFERLKQLSGKAHLAEIWPNLEAVVHGGVKFDPYRKTFEEVLGSPGIRLQESYPCSEGFIAFGDPGTEHLRLVYDHGLFYEFVPVEELDSASPTRHWLGSVETGVNYAIVVSTCAGLWSHVIGDTVRFESNHPPLLRFTGRTKYTLSAFGEHLISEEVESAIAAASEATGAAVRDWHVGPVFEGVIGYHQYVIEFLRPPDDLGRFRDLLDADLCRRNADYQAHRAEGVGMPPPSILVASPDGLNAWMKSRGKLGGQHKFPRMDSSGVLTAEILSFIQTVAT